MSKKRVKKQPDLIIDDDCDCSQCRMRDAIFVAAADDSGGGIVSIDPMATAMDMIPTLGIITSYMPYDLVQKWMNLIVDARARRLDPKSDLMPEIKGRA